MRSKKSKLLLSALIIALIVSILPMGIFANADKEETRVIQERRVKLITEREARKIAIESVKAEVGKKVDLEVTDSIDDTKIGKLQYYFKIESPTHLYFVEVHARTGKVLRFVEMLREELDEEKPDEKTAKKEAIAEFQTAMKAANNEKLENKDDFHNDKDYYKTLKKKAIEDFKKAKDDIKAAKKEQKQELKEEKKSNKKDDKPINEIKYLTEKQIKEIAAKKFNNKDIDKMDIELNIDKNPPLYIVEAYDTKNKVEYELVIHATTGTILEYERALD